MVKFITRKIKKLVEKFQKRYGKVLGVVLVIGVVVFLPLPIPGVCLGLQGVGEILRLVGVRF